LRYRLLVWDFDGTLADTMALALLTYNAMATRHGFRPVEDVDAARRMTVWSFLRRHEIPPIRLPQLAREYLSAIRGRMAGIRLYDGVPHMLRTLQAAGCRLGVLSSNTAENIAACFQANGVEDLFGFVIGYPRLFGKERAIRKLLQREGLQPKHILYVGDEVRDVKAARKAGVDIAAVAWGFHSLDLLSRYAPTYLWTKPSEVLPALVAGG
jgi:phosphoglycolate phosphatase